MKLRDDNHLHIDEQDPIADWLVRSMRTAQTGSIKLDIEGQPTVKIDIINNGNKIVVDLLQPVFFRTLSCTNSDILNFRQSVSSGVRNMAIGLVA